MGFCPRRIDCVTKFTINIFDLFFVLLLPGKLTLSHVTRPFYLRFFGMLLTNRCTRTSILCHLKTQRVRRTKVERHVYLCVVDTFR